MMDERKDARTDGQTDGRTWATLNALPHSTNSGGIKIRRYVKKVLIAEACTDPKEGRGSGPSSP